VQDRHAALNALRARQNTAGQVVIVGAGINGIGLYRDLALQGVPAILFDKGDFSSGTSAAPSRLIHGGLRYLETGEFALVRESVIERNQLLLNASHLVKPLPTWVPAFSWFGGSLSAVLRFLGLKKTPGAKGVLVVKLGLVFYDWFARANRTMPKHRVIPRAASRKQMPMLSPTVRGVAEYYDARLIHPERLALELVKDAERDCPDAVAVPYVSLEGMEGGKLVLRDEVSGERLSLTPSLVVNCAGAWADVVNRSIGIDQRMIGGTRGSHLVMRRPDLCKQLAGCMLYFETHDHRACLVYPLDDNLILLGTTDIRDENPDSADCHNEEIDYLFGVLDEVLPGSKAKREEIVFVYAGVRPLPWSGASATGAISRDHALKVSEPDSKTPFPVMTLVGGKWTTYRSCAEENCRVVLKHLGKPHLRSTLHEPVGGSAGLPKDSQGLAGYRAHVAAAASIDGAVAAELVRRYGSQAMEVAQSVARSRRVLAGNAAYHEGEIRWITRTERVTHLADIILRRTLLPFEDGLSSALLADIAAIAADELGWDDERQARELQDTTALLQKRHRVPSLAAAHLA
jgi:glycerol-3-phosphate dehydrogenase